MKRLILFSILIFAIRANGQTHPVIDQLMQRINADTLAVYMNELTGNVPVTVNGEEVTFFTRNAYDPMNQKVEEYLMEKFSSLGYEAERDSFNMNGNNIIASKSGSVHPEKLVIIGAHFDNMPYLGRAPGADDNASGSVAVLEAARIMAGFDFPYTIVFALWDYEEMGLVGSEHYAESLYQEGAEVIGYFNMDMISYDANNDARAGVNVNPYFYEIGATTLAANETYDIGLDLYISLREDGRSDYLSFWKCGFPAVGLNENDREFHPYYHTENDDLPLVNQEYHEKCARLAIATTAWLALGIDLDISHTPAAYFETPEGLQLEAAVATPLIPGTGENAPRLYYRLSDEDDFNYVQGNLKEGGVYTFDLGSLPDVCRVDYFIAAADNDRYIVKTLPHGGSDLDLPGALPDSFYTMFITPYVEHVTFDCNSLEGWTAEGSWGLSDNEWSSPPFSFTDSPGKNYASSTLSALTGSVPFEYSNAIGGYIEFKTKFDIQEGGDWGAFYLKEAGAEDWFTPAGIVNEPSTGSQPGNYVYDGVSDWITEKINLDSLAEGNYLMKFELGSNALANREGWYIDDIDICVYKAAPTGVEEEAGIPVHFALAQNYPNPFNPSTVIRYDMPEGGRVSLKVYDILGREAAVLVNANKPAGSHKVTFDASGLASGIYVYRLETPGFAATRKMALVR